MVHIIIMVVLVLCFWILLISDKALKIKEKETSMKRGMLLILRDTLLLIVLAVGIIIYNNMS